MKLFNSYTNRTFECRCGTSHQVITREVHSGVGCLRKIPEMLVNCGFIGRGLVVGDDNTFAAAGDAVSNLLTRALRPFEKLTLRPRKSNARVLVETEQLRCVRTRLKSDFQWVLAVGSGTVNDLVKIAATRANIPYAAVITAPSVDGFLSPAAVCVRNGLREQRPRLNPPLGVIADWNILKNAPPELLRAGLGESLSKNTSLLDWQMNRILCGEPCCERSVKLVRTELNELMRIALESDGFSENLCGALIKSLLAEGLAMQLAGDSRPSAGGEHWFSHAAVMLQLAHAGQVSTYHGLEVAAGTWLSLVRYKQLFNGKCRRPLHFLPQEDYRRMVGNWLPENVDFSFMASRKFRMQNKAETRLPELDECAFRRVVGGTLDLYEDIRRIYRKFSLPHSLLEAGLTEKESVAAEIACPVIRDRISIWDLTR